LNIKKITAENYYQFDDMVYRRMHGREREDSDYIISDEIRCELSNDNLYMYGVELNFKMIGWISLIYMPKVGKYNGRGHIYVDELWIEPTYRGKGYSKVLMDKADELCLRLNALGIRLYVSQDNVSAKCLYENCGYNYSGQSLFMTKEIVYKCKI
jgi:GNAT superfamily N-acetyltransferase